MPRLFTTAFLAGTLLAACAPANAPSPTPPTAATRTQPVTQPRAIPTADNARVRIVSVQGAKPGSEAMATLETTPEALCRAQYAEPQGLIISTPSLTTQIADNEGKVTYTWPIRPDSRTGAGKLRVNCNGAEATADVPIG